MHTVVITGSSKGIGKGMAREFLQRGCNVVISARTQSTVDATVGELAAQFDADRVVGTTRDVTDIDQVQALWDLAVRTFGAVSHWINNAGMISDNRRFWEVEPDEMKTVILSNIIGHMYGVRVAMHGMEQQGSGAIYNFYGFGCNDEKQPAGMVTYGITKRAIRYMTECLIEETKDSPILIGSLMPGTVITDLMLKTIRTMPAGQREQLKKSFNIVADTVETVAPYLVEEILKNTTHGAEINWMPMEKFQARLKDPFYQSRDLFSEIDV